MKCQLFSPKDLSEYGRQLLVDYEIDNLLWNKTCTICGGQFISRDEKDNAIVSDKRDGQLFFAHDYCWGDENEST